MTWNKKEKITEINSQKVVLTVNNRMPSCYLVCINETGSFYSSCCYVEYQEVSGSGMNQIETNLILQIKNKYFAM